MTVQSGAEPRDVSDFVRERGQALTRTAYLLCGDLASAEDLVHAALTAALPRWNRIEHHYSYVRRSILHGYLDTKRRNPPSSLDDVSGQLLDGAGSTLDLETRDALWRCVVGLPARERAVLVLGYYEDLDDSEISAVLGIRESSVRSHKSRALARIRRTHLHLLGDSS
jgi:RNA polymerase sigma factor (sigma-70 family)